MDKTQPAPNLVALWNSLKGSQSRRYLDRLVTHMCGSGNPDESFYYLGGPMTGIPQFNFPRFKEIGDKLRAQGYNIISPAEMDDPETAKIAWESPDGDPGRGEVNGRSHNDLVGRDFIILAMPNCRGMICMENWHRSRGAAGESWVCSFLGKELYEYDEAPDGSPVLWVIKRDEQLQQHGVDAEATGTLPKQRPGELIITKEAQA